MKAKPKQFWWPEFIRCSFIFLLAKKIGVRICTVLIFWESLWNLVNSLLTYLMPQEVQCDTLRQDRVGLAGQHANFRRYLCKKIHRLLWLNINTVHILNVLNKNYGYIIQIAPLSLVVCALNQHGHLSTKACWQKNNYYNYCQGDWALLWIDNQHCAWKSLSVQISSFIVNSWLRYFHYHKTRKNPARKS